MSARRMILGTALAALALVASAVLAGCGALDEGGSTSDAPKGATKVRVGYLHTIAVDDKLQYGLAKGYFADQGLAVEAKQFDTGIAVSQALASGDIDVAIMGGVTSNFPARGQGTIFMVNSLETATARLWVQGGSEISSVAELKGKTLVTTEGTTADIYLNAAMKKAGLKRSEVKVVNAPMPSAVQAFTAKSADAIALWVPFDLRVKEGDPGATEIDNAGNYPDATVADGWIANNQWYAKHKPVARKIVKGWLAANAAFRKDPDAALAVVQKKAYDGEATLADLKYQVRFQQDFTNAEWAQKYSSGEVAGVIGTAERAFVELGGLPAYVDPDKFFDSDLFVTTQKAEG